MESLAENAAVLAHTTGTANSTPLLTAWASAKHSGRINLLARLGDMASETIDIALYQAQDGSGTGAKALKAATQLAASAGGNDNTAHVISVDANDLDIEGGFSFVAGRIVTGGATGGTVSMFVIGTELRFAPASLIDAATVTVTP
jgi:hypothetical protein